MQRGCAEAEKGKTGAVYVAYRDSFSFLSGPMMKTALQA